jgi:hypothetical protein
MKEQPHMEEVESYWKSLWEEKVKHNEEAEWIRREEREKEETNNMNWIPIGTTETTSFLSKLTTGSLLESIRYQIIG